MCSDKGSTTKCSCVGSMKEHTPPAVCLTDLGSVDLCVENMLEFVSMPLAHPEVYLHTGVQPLYGVLLHGPLSCGKTMLENAISGGGGFKQELSVPFIVVLALLIVSGVSGELEKMLHKVFEEAKVCTFCPCREPNHLNMTYWCFFFLESIIVHLRV